MLQFPILIYISSKWLFWWKLFHGVGEGNGNPLQCSCLENPRDGGAWWAAVYGVAQSRTRLKQLSSSSSSFHGVARFGHNLATKPPLPYNFICTMKVKVKMLVVQSCSTFCDPLDWTVSPPGSSVHGILQARILEWVACPPPADLSDPGIKPGSPAFQADSLLSEPQGKPICIMDNLKLSVCVMDNFK